MYENSNKNSLNCQRWRLGLYTLYTPRALKWCFGPSARVQLIYDIIQDLLRLDDQEFRILRGSVEYITLCHVYCSLKGSSWAKNSLHFLSHCVECLLNLVLSFWQILEMRLSFLNSRLLCTFWHLCIWFLSQIMTQSFCFLKTWH